MIKECSPGPLPETEPGTDPGSNQTPAAEIRIFELTRLTVRPFYGAPYDIDPADPPADDINYTLGLMLTGKTVELTTESMRFGLITALGASGAQRYTLNGGRVFFEGEDMRSQIESITLSDDLLAISANYAFVAFSYEFRPV